jgi:hypothetical protein
VKPFGAMLVANQETQTEKRRVIMNMIKWQPFGEFDDTFARLIPSLFGRSSRLRADSGEKFTWAPSADISETDAEYLIRAELPAVKEGRRQGDARAGNDSPSRATRGRQGSEGSRSSIAVEEFSAEPFFAQLLGT